MNAQIRSLRSLKRNSFGKQGRRRAFGTWEKLSQDEKKRKWPWGCRVWHLQKKRNSLGRSSKEGNRRQPDQKKLGEGKKKKKERHKLQLYLEEEKRYSPEKKILTRAGGRWVPLAGEI